MKKIIACANAPFYETTFYIGANTIQSNSERFIDAFSSISRKFGICMINSSLSPKNNAFYRQTINENDPRIIIARMFFDSGRVNSIFPCVIYKFDEKGKVINYLYDDFYEPFIELRFVQYLKHNRQELDTKYGMILKLRACCFLPEYTFFNGNEEEYVDNKYLYYLNTTRYNSFIRELKNMFIKIGIIDRDFYALNDDFAIKSNYNDEELIKIGREVIYYEDIYELLPENEKYRPFEEIIL